MIPIPQYPLYTATLAYLESEPLPYYLSEADDWSMNHDSLLKSVEEGKKKGIPIKSLVIINPGHPTGASLSQEAMEAVVHLCYEEGIVLLADEVYQMNVFDPEQRPFISFKKVLMDMPKEIRESVELVSFHSISKGVSGECGRRGGYFECVNIDKDVMDQVYKMASVTLCPPVSGQVSPKFHTFFFPCLLNPLILFLIDRCRPHGLPSETRRRILPLMERRNRSDPKQSQVPIISHG